MRHVHMNQSYRSRLIPTSRQVAPWAERYCAQAMSVH